MGQELTVQGSKGEDTAGWVRNWLCRAVKERRGHSRVGQELALQKGTNDESRKSQEL